MHMWGATYSFIFLLTSASRTLTLPPNRLSEEQFPPARKRSTPRGERFLPGIEPKGAEYNLTTLILTRGATR
jgi:hypothetical protein